MRSISLSKNIMQFSPAGGEKDEIFAKISIWT
jgi:hypothetical protein